MKPLKVGITVAGQHQDAVAALWANGVTQNIVYLALLFQRMPEIGLTVLVNCPPQADGPHPLAELYGLATYSVAEAVAGLDVIVEVGSRADNAVMNRFREKGGKVVSYMAGNALVMNFENMANQTGFGDQVVDHFDACWITPQHWRTNHAYAEITRTPNTHMAPHIWHPLCLMQAIFRTKTAPFWRPLDKPSWRVGVFDPNVNVVKTFHLPLMVVEHAFRTRPDLIERVLLFSAIQLIGNPHFEEFCNGLDIGQAKKIFAEGRFPVAEMLGTHIDAVVAHQWENNLNYAYWDVLYLGWPLIHNSAAFAEVGYYYPEFDPRTGGQVLTEALDGHAHRARKDRAKVLELLWGFNVDNPVVQSGYADLFGALMN